MRISDGTDTELGLGLIIATKWKKPWIPKVRKVTKGVKNAYGYFNNHFHGYAVENCLTVLEMLGVLTPEQAHAKTAVENYLERAKMKKPTLEAFIKPKEMTLENLLNAFIDKPRLKRAQRIKDKELTIQEATDNQVKALIRDYHIVINLPNRLVLHDCADWSRSTTRQKILQTHRQTIAITRQGKGLKNPQADLRRKSSM